MPQKVIPAGKGPHGKGLPLKTNPTSPQSQTSRKPTAEMTPLIGSISLVKSATRLYFTAKSRGIQSLLHACVSTRVHNNLGSSWRMQRGFSVLCSSQKQKEVCRLETEVRSRHNAIVNIRAEHETCHKRDKAKMSSYRYRLVSPRSMYCALIIG